jgi:hypothetical protein
MIGSYVVAESCDCTVTTIGYMFASDFSQVFSSIVHKFCYIKW